ncbi:hypothetical protein BYT27DRAFT_7201879 [Phlegmacium glaucopus]|nr:hypothetical protein BYT27DRAFT_7201879 [Phlegmacium glaucopus]
MDELIQKLNIDKNRITGVSHKSAAWNVKMMATTALLCALSITPYIYINLGSTNHLHKSTRWAFPVLRAAGGFITATLIQRLIRRRITTLSDQYLVKGDQPPNTDVEAAVEPRDTKEHQTDVRTLLLLFFLIIGLLASVVGYVGCFSVVQNSISRLGPVSWLCLEAGLSVMRLGIWAWNPKRDEAPPLEIILELDEHEPFPTCNKDSEEILQYKVLPLTRARDFLKIITSYAGLIEPFSSPDLSLYYTLTRKRPSKQSVPVDGENERENGDSEPGNGDSEPENADSEPENAERPRLGERILYITVFDHKERTTRVYTRDNKIDTFYSTNSDAPSVDVGHLLLEVEIDAKIDPKADPVCSDSNNVDSLRKHHRSILEHIHYRLGAANISKAYTIENSWTMKAEDTMSALQRLREEENGDDWKTAAVEKGKEKERNEESLVICDYFMQSSIERERRLLDEKRVKWIARRMEMITKEATERFEGKMGVQYRVDKQAVEKKPATELSEREMELLLLYEVKEWEQRFWNKLKDVLDQIGNNRVEEKERLTREWRANRWKRLNPQMHAAEKRLADLDKDSRWDRPREKIQRGWASLISQSFEGVKTPNPEALSVLRREIRHSSRSIDTKYRGEIRLRIEKEIEDVEFRLKRGSELGRFDQFWDDNDLFKCRYSRSKWLCLYIDHRTPLEIYSHALKGNKNIIHITFGPYSDVNWIQAIIRDLPWVTSISEDLPGGLPASRDPLFIKSPDNDLITFAKEIRLKLDSFSTYIFTDSGGYDVRSDPGRIGGDAKVLISFVAPTSGQSLVLRLKHSGKYDVPLEAMLGSTIIQLNPSSESSLTIDDITLRPIPGPSESDHLSFEPGIRNDIVIQFRGIVGYHGHFLHDIELHDEDGKHYGMPLYSEMDPKSGASE